MYKRLKVFFKFLKRLWRGILLVVCVFHREGQQSLLDSVRARADLLLLAVEQKRVEIEFQRANYIADLAQNVEKIKDPQLKKKAIAAISSSGCSLLMAEMHGRSPGGTDASRYHGRRRR